MLPFLTQVAQACQPRASFFGLPTWYKYLEGRPETVGGVQTCQVEFTQLKNVWAIVAALFEMATMIAAVVAVGFVFYGGFRIMTSQGDPEGLKQGRTTVINALIGLAIAVVAGRLVSWVAFNLL